MAALALALLLFEAEAQPAQARERAALPPGLVASAPGTAVEVTDGDTLILDDGRTVRLVGIQAPKLPLGRAGFPTWPLAPSRRSSSIGA
jgi:endonuclease YncB( thermonuclease family)